MAHFLNIHENYPAIFDELEFDSIINMMKMTNYNELNDNTVEQIIILDNDDLFIEYLSKCNLILKFKGKSSKSLDHIIELIIKYKPKKIMNTLIKLKIISNYYKYKIIFLSEQFEFFNQTALSMIMEQDSFEDDNVVIEEQDIIPEFFEEIIKRNLVRSFYIITNLFDNIIDENIKIIFNIENNDIFQLLIDMKPELINTKINDITLLMHYSNIGLEKHILTLLNKKAKYIDIDNKGNNFLHYLVRNNHSHILSKVCKYVLDIIDHQNDNLESPILLSAKLGFENIFFILKGNKVNLDLIDKYGNSVYHYICLNKICLNMIVPYCTNKFNYTPKDYCNISHEFYYFLDKN
jgi:hypothetical protein